MQYDVGAFLVDKYRDAHCVHVNKSDNDRVAVLVETRDSFFLPLVIKNFCSVLGTAWNIHLFVPGQVMEFLRTQLPACSMRITIINVTGKFGPEQYSALLRSPMFWSEICEEKILLFQTDSIILRPVPAWALQFDNIGAPCGTLTPTDFVHNGGFSLRSKKAMLGVLAHHPESDDRPEDVFFSQEMRLANTLADSSVYRLASLEKSAKFGAESFAVPGCIGIHGTDKYYMTGDAMERLIADSEALKI